MNPLTRQRLDALDARLEQLGLRRQRRGLMIADVSAQMTKAVALQPRGWPDGLVWVHCFAQVYWHPVDKILSRGLGMHWKRFGVPTVTVLRMGDGPEQIPGGAGAEAALEQAVAWVASDVLRCAEALASPQALLARADDAVSRQNPQAAPRYLAMRIWAEQDLDPPGVMEALRARLLGRDFDLEELETFHGRLLEASPEAVLADRS